MPVEYDVGSFQAYRLEQKGLISVLTTLIDMICKFQS